MSTAGDFDATPVTDRRQLAAWFEAGAKPKDSWRIGTEHEKFGFRLADRKPLPYDGDGPTIRKMIEGLGRFGWEPVFEAGLPIAARRAGATISLEPGGQFELSGAPLEHLHETCAETGEHLKEVKAVADEIGAGFLGLAFAPDWLLDEMPMMPKARYKIMRDYMPKVGRMGREMMFRTCTIQTNLDFGSEADMVRKMRVGLALQPVATALFANSPFACGRPNGFVSLRAHVWTDTDNERTGMLPFVFEPGFSFEHYADWAIAAPMYFVRRGERLHDVSGYPFQLFMEGRLPGLEGERPTFGDWADHLTTLFPEARLKRFIEVRGADGGPWSRICALPAFWVGLFYDEDCLAAAWDLAKDWTAEERDMLRATAPKLGLRTPFRSTDLQAIAQAAVAIAKVGLERRARLSPSGESNESWFLRDLEEVAETGVTFAERLLERWRGAWGGDLSQIYVEEAY